MNSRPRMKWSDVWATALLLSFILTLILSGIPTCIEHTFDSQPIAFYINGSGCSSYQQIDMFPQDSKLASVIDRIDHCHGPGGRGTGLILIRTVDMLSHAVFRVRLTGPELHIVHIRHYSDKLHYGEYRVGRPGEYYVEVMMLYTSFNETRITESVVQDIKDTWVSASPLLNPSEALLEHSSDTLCKSEATWVVEPEFVKYVRRTRTWSQDPWPAGHPLIHDVLPGTNATGLRFESNCQAIYPESMYEPLYGDCVQRSRVCMWGDSQMRHLYNTIVAAVFDDSGASIKNKEVLDGQGCITYFPKTYDNFDHDIDNLVDSGNCTVILANFGQWPAGWLQGYPWSFDKYKIYVEADIVYLKRLVEKHSGLTVFWMTTNPHGFAGYGILAGQEWRTYPVLDGYNNIALQLARSHGVETLNTYRIAKPLNDLTYDGSHYLGIVGWTMASYVLQNICGA